MALIETKIGLALAISSAMLAVAETPTSPLGAYTQLGLAGAALGIVWWIIAKRDPAIAKEHAEALREAAKNNAEALREAAKSNADALTDLKEALASHADRTYNLLADAIHCPLPKRPRKPEDLAE